MLSYWVGKQTIAGVAAVRPSKPLSEWIPVESFDSIEDCRRARTLQIAVLMAPETDDFRITRSRCISLAEFKPAKEAM